MQTKVKPLSTSKVDDLRAYSEYKSRLNGNIPINGNIRIFEEFLPEYIEFFWQENFKGYKETFAIQNFQDYHSKKLSFVRTICLDIFNEIRFKYIPSDLILKYFDFYLKSGGRSNFRFKEHELLLADNLYVNVCTKVVQLREEG